MMDIIAMIPARLGSKRIPGKNLRYLGEKPLIQYPIDLAVDSGLFREIWVTTEAEGLKPFVESCGAKFHKRPEEHSSDQATNRGFVLDFLQNHLCDYAVMINTTSPLLSLETLKGFMEFVKESKYDTVMSVVSDRTESFFRGSPLNFCVSNKVNSQFIEPVERVVWALTAWKRETYIANEAAGVMGIFGGKVGKFEIPKDESCDLDAPEDWNVAEGMLRAREERMEARYLVLTGE